MSRGWLVERFGIRRAVTASLLIPCTMKALYLGQLLARPIRLGDHVTQGQASDAVNSGMRSASCSLLGAIAGLFVRMISAQSVYSRFHAILACLLLSWFCTCE